MFFTVTCKHYSCFNKLIIERLFKVFYLWSGIFHYIMSEFTYFALNISPRNVENKSYVLFDKNVVKIKVK